MPSVRVFPFLRAPQCWRPGDWEMQVATDAWRPLPDQLPEFDYATPLAFRYRCEVNAERMRQQTGLGRDAVVAAYLLVDCAATGRRFVGRTEFRLDARSVTRDVELRIPVGTVGGKPRLSRGLATISPGTDDEPPAPVRPGSRLVEDEPRALALEGSYAHFPTETASFEKLGWRPTPWYLWAGFETLAEPFLGTVRLFVNTDHPAGAAVLRAPDDNGVGAMACSAVKTDIVRGLVAEIARRDPDELDTGAATADSVGQAAESMARLYLRRSLAEAVRLYVEDPRDFDRELQVGTDYLRLEAP